MGRQEIEVWIKWKSGFAKRSVPFWLADKYIIRDFLQEWPHTSGPFEVIRP